MQENLLQEAKLHFNEPILMSFEVCRCIGYAEDEEDCYLIVHSPSRGVYWSTFVGGYIYLTCLKDEGVTVPLYPSYPGEIWTNYSRLDSLLELNGVPKAEKFLIVEKKRTYIDLDNEVTCPMCLRPVDSCSCL
jgi:hypothetical protein